MTAASRDRQVAAGNLSSLFFTIGAPLGDLPADDETGKPDTEYHEVRRFGYRGSGLGPRRKCTKRDACSCVSRCGDARFHETHRTSYVAPAQSLWRRRPALEPTTSIYIMAVRPPENAPAARHPAAPNGPLPRCAGRNGRSMLQAPRWHAPPRLPVRDGPACRPRRWQ